MGGHDERPRTVAHRGETMRNIATDCGAIKLFCNAKGLA